MQDYTPLGSTATTTVKDGILNHEKNINALRSTYSGTAFPTENLVAGMKCYRTDLVKTYVYNGKTWTDAVSTSSLTVSGETSVPTPATTNKSNTIANTEFVHGVVSDLVNGAPTALDTLQELASALGNDPNFSTTILNKIGEKENKTDAQIEHEKLQNAIPTKTSQLTDDVGYAKIDQTVITTGDAFRLDNKDYVDINDVRLLKKSSIICLYNSTASKIANQPEPNKNRSFFLFNFKDIKSRDDIADRWLGCAQFFIYLSPPIHIFHRRVSGAPSLTKPTFFAWKQIVDTDITDALANKIPTKVSQLTNDSNYATTAETDAIANRIPTKTSQLTNDSDFANVASLETEAKKWKDAYNNLRKRSVPTQFEDDELTVLMDAPLSTGKITLSQPYTDFDGLLIEYTDDNGNAFARKYMSTAELNTRIARSISIKGSESAATIALLSGEQYWRIWCGKSRGFTPTTFPAWTENSIIYRIYGVKFKEIT